MTITPETRNKEKGFTLIEILIAMAVGGIIMAAISKFYTHQMDLFSRVKHMTAVQQNLRTSMFLLEEEIKQACLDPMGSAKPRIVTATPGVFEFQSDLNGNGHEFTLPDASGSFEAQSGNDPHEWVLFRLSDDSDDDGKADGFPCNLTRKTWRGSPYPMAENIEVLDFVYLDADNQPLNTPSTDTSEIEAVVVTMIGRSEIEINPGKDTWTYQNPYERTLLDEPGDYFYRKMLSKVIRLRNR